MLMRLSGIATLVALSACRASAPEPPAAAVDAGPAIGARGRWPANSGDADDFGGGGLGPKGIGETGVLPDGGRGDGKGIGLDGIGVLDAGRTAPPRIVN